MTDSVHPSGGDLVPYRNPGHGVGQFVSSDGASYSSYVEVPMLYTPCTCSTGASQLREGVWGVFSYGSSRDKLNDD